MTTKNGGVTVTIKGTLYWANLVQKNKMSGKYQVEVGQLTNEEVQTLKSVGISVKNKQDERGDYVTLTSVFSPKVVDSKLNEVAAESLSLGNGSLVKAVVAPYTWNFNGKKGIGGGLNALQVLKVVEFKPGIPGLTEEDGFVAFEDSSEKNGGDSTDLCVEDDIDFGDD